MSVVGPRPHMLKHTEEYSKLIDKYMVRHFVKPGITGWAQVTGFRGETKKLWQMEGRVERDIGIWNTGHSSGTVGATRKPVGKTSVRHRVLITVPMHNLSYHLHYNRTGYQDNLARTYLLQAEAQRRGKQGILVL